jgi:branched-chain amino acid transport system permease protein
MGAAKQAVHADVGEQADVSAAEGALAERSSGRKVLPIVEGIVLVAALLAPMVLQDYLTVFATRVVILALFALSFDLVWGYAGIMSFGQALFFGSAGYGVALLARDLNVTNILLVLPAGTLIGLAFSLLLGGFLLLGRHPSSVIFVSLGTLTGSYAADRLLSRARPPRRRLPALPLPGALAIRPCVGGTARERAAHRLLRLQGAAPEGDHLHYRWCGRRPCRQPLCLP